MQNVKLGIVVYYSWTKSDIIILLIPFGNDQVLYRYVGDISIGPLNLQQWFSSSFHLQSIMATKYGSIKCFRLTKSPTCEPFYKASRHIGRLIYQQSSLDTNI